MAKVTKKWEKEFPKRYSNAIKELQSLENEYQQMVNDNPDSYISVYPDESFLELGALKSTYSSYYEADQNEENPQEHVEITFNGEVGSFSFLINSLEILDKLLKVDNISFCKDLDIFTPCCKASSNISPILSAILRKASSTITAVSSVA